MPSVKLNFLKVSIVVQTYPSTLLCNPSGRVSFHDECCGIDEGDQVLGVAGSNAVHGQTSGHAVERDDLGPSEVTVPPSVKQILTNRTKDPSNGLLIG